MPAEARQRIKLLVLDSLGCALYRAALPWSRILMETLDTLDGTRACAVRGTDRRLGAPRAALVSSTLVQRFELDDVYRRGILHVGPVTAPALLAMGELRRGLSGREFLITAVAG